MRKWKVLISLLMIMIFIGSPGLAVKKNSSIMVSMDGKKHKVVEVPVVMDGKPIYLDIPTFIHKDYTFVPIRFIAEYYGAEVKWDQKTKTATVTQKNKEIKMSINSKYVYIDGKEKILDSVIIPKLVTFSNNDSRTMVPLRFISETLGYKVGWDNSNKVPFINTPKDDGKDEKEEVDLSHLNKVGKIEKEIIQGKESIVIYNTDKVSTNVMKLKNPERIVIDLMDSYLQGGNYFNYNYELGFIKGIRLSQFSPDNNYKPNDKIVRIVLDVKEGVRAPNAKINIYDDKIVIVPETSIWEVINYSLEGTDRTVSINANKKTNYDVEYANDKKSMTIHIPSENMDLQEGTVSIMDGLINDITVKKVGDNTEVILTFRRGIEYEILSRNEDDRIAISLRRDQNIKPSDMLIAIDSGHGGKDPGAVSPNGTREKDINISISQKLNKGLKDKGYSTLMIRDSDVFVNLYERANIANKNQADIFISIHSNSHPKNDIAGIQVLYNPESKDIESYPLAKLIMDELLKGTGAKDRGIIKRPNLVVLNKTSMPAVLIEVGFLSNPVEEKLIRDETYQDKIVKSIIKGIEKYFEMY